MTTIVSLARRGLSTQVASAGARQLAETNDVVGVRLLANRLNQAKKIIGEVTGKRTDINEIAEVWLKAIRKGGRLLREMREAGERHSGYGNNPPRELASRGARPTLAQLGFTYSRASRWELAEWLPQSAWNSLIKEIKASEDGILTLAAFLALAKHLANEEERLNSATPTTASITCASCLDWLLQQPQCDLLLTDPPYMTDVDDITAFASWLPVALKKVKRTGRAYICIGAYPEELRAYLTTDVPSDMILAQVLVWTYRNTLGPSPTHDYKSNWQAILYYRGVDAPPLDCPKMIEQFAVQDINAPDGRQGDRWHAWQKPDELADRLIRHSSAPGNLVLDPFAGSGSFILAAAKLGRIAHGCDMNPEMVTLAGSRGCNVR